MLAFFVHEAGIGQDRQEDSRNQETNPVNPRKACPSKIDHTARRADELWSLVVRNPRKAH